MRERGWHATLAGCNRERGWHTTLAGCNREREFPTVICFHSRFGGWWVVQTGLPPSTRTQVAPSAPTQAIDVKALPIMMSTEVKKVSSAKISSSSSSSSSSSNNSSSSSSSRSNVVKEEKERKGELRGRVVEEERKELDPQRLAEEELRQVILAKSKRKANQRAERPPATTTPTKTPLPQPVAPDLISDRLQGKDIPIEREAAHEERPSGCSFPIVGQSLPTLPSLPSLSSPSLVSLPVKFVEEVPLATLLPLSLDTIKVIGGGGGAPLDSLDTIKVIGGGGGAPLEAAESEHKGNSFRTRHFLQWVDPSMRSVLQETVSQLTASQLVHLANILPLPGAGTFLFLGATALRSNALGCLCKQNRVAVYRGGGRCCSCS